MGSIAYRIYRPLTNEEIANTFSCSMKTYLLTVFCTPVEIPKAVVDVIQREIYSLDDSHEHRQTLIDFLELCSNMEEEA